MSRAVTTCAELAEEAGIEEDEALLALWDAGFDIRAPSERIPRRLVALARRTLGLSRPRSLSRSQRIERAQSRRVLPVERVVTPSTPPTPAQPKKQRKPKKQIPTFRWEIVGRREPIRFLVEEELNAIHWAIVEDFRRDRDPIKPPGIRDVSLFGSAIYRPQTSLSGHSKYPTTAMAGAALFHSIVHNHPFQQRKQTDGARGAHRVPRVQRLGHDC